MLGVLVSCWLLLLLPFPIGCCWCCTHFLLPTQRFDFGLVLTPSCVCTDDDPFAWSYMPLYHFALCCCAVTWLWLGYMWWPFPNLYCCFVPLFISCWPSLVCAGWWEFYPDHTCPYAIFLYVAMLCLVVPRLNVMALATPPLIYVGTVCPLSFVLGLLFYAYGWWAIPFDHTCSYAILPCAVACLWLDYVWWPWLPLSQPMCWWCALFNSCGSFFVCVWMMRHWNRSRCWTLVLLLCLGFTVVPSLIYVCVYVSPH